MKEEKSKGYKGGKKGGTGRREGGKREGKGREKDGKR